MQPLISDFAVCHDIVSLSYSKSKATPIWKGNAHVDCNMEDFIVDIQAFVG